MVSLLSIEKNKRVYECLRNTGGYVLFFKQAKNKLKNLKSTINICNIQEKNYFTKAE
jgi:hypothetical protein